MVIDSYREIFFCILLPYDILIEKIVNLFGLRYAFSSIGFALAGIFTLLKLHIT